MEWLSFNLGSNNGHKKKQNSSHELDFDPESLTNKERLSRMLHMARKTAKAPDGKELYEKFILVGLKSTPSSSKTADKEPEILFEYPNNTSKFTGLVHFCFPKGMRTRRLRRTPSQSNLYQLMCSQTQFTHSENSFIFMLTTETKDVLYGVCVSKYESVEHIPSFMKEQMNESTSPPSSPNGTKDTVAPSSLNKKPAAEGKKSQGKRRRHSTFPVAKRCYCLITRYPFFNLHFEVLYSILAIEHMHNMALYCIAPLREDDFIHYKKPSRINSKSNSIQEPQESSQPPTDGSNSSSQPSTASSAQPTIDNNNSENSSVDSPEKALELKQRTEALKNFSAIEVLSRYRQLPVPARGQTVSLSVPTSNQPITFTRPVTDDEEEALCDWSLPLVFYSLSTKDFFKLLTGCMLEKKIAIVCSNLRVLSAIVLSLIPLLRPFIYQSVLVPIVPAKLASLIEAPVPFVLGFPKLPSSVPSDVMILDVEQQTFKLPASLPDFPKRKELEHEFQKDYHELRSTFVDGQPPWTSTSLQLRLSKRISAIFERHMAQLFDGFRSHCIRDLTQSKPVTIFLKESFLESVPKSEQNFFGIFLQTQMFFHYQDKRLRLEDEASWRSP